METSNLVEFLVLLLISASLIALATSRLRIPYTIALIFGGFAIDLFHLPITELLGSESQVLTPDVIFVVFLPGLLFESGININLRHLRENIRPIMLLAIAGILVSTVITGYAVSLTLELPILVALLFGALISATDPISVLALFKDMGVHKRLATIVEGESLFNDGTAVVVFQILLAGVLTGDLALADGVRQFFVVSIGGTALGLLIGYAASKLTAQVDDARIEITLTTIVAYGSYLMAESLHVSGIIATVLAGVMVGSYGAPTGMSARTRVALWSFWEYFAFVINSLVFLLIGIEVHIADLAASWLAIAIAIVAVLLARVLTIYSLTPVGNRFSLPISVPWQHILVWGGLHGGVSMALALSLPPDFPFRQQLLAMTFGVVTFSIVVQGLTMKPLLRKLGLEQSREEAYDKLKVRRMAATAAKNELDQLLEQHLITQRVHEQLAEDLNEQAANLSTALDAFHTNDPQITQDEVRLARGRMAEARKSVIVRATTDGLVTMDGAEHMLSELDEGLDELRGH